jgi:ABC-type nitrate/sulfonate/bicarbonate transport system permease component
VRRRTVGLLLEAGAPALLVAAWWIWSVRAHSFYFPPLPDILDTFRATWLFDRVGSDLARSLGRLGAGFAIAVAAGIAAGVALGSSPAARRAAAPLVEFLRAIPPVALIPFGIVVWGIGDGMKVFVIAMVCVWPVLLNTIDGVAGLDLTLAETAHAYGIEGVQRLRRVVLPSAAPQIFAGVRTGVSLALIVMVVSEMVASTNGVGYFVVQSQRSFAIPEMWSGIVVLGLLGYALNLAVVVVERRVLRWHRGARARLDP